VKKILLIIQIILSTGLLLSACSAFNQEPQLPPITENDVWKVEILGIEKYTEPKAFVCSDCDLTTPMSSLNLQDKSTYIKVTAKIVNKSVIQQTAPDENIGLLLRNKYYGCGGLTLAGSDYCLPSGLIRGGKNFVNYGINTPDFKNTLTFEPNSPNGEIIEFVFIIKNNAKYTDFYFAGLPPIKIEKIKAEIIK
jgi:hypothetical protein